MTKPIPFERRWWTTELKKMKKDMFRKARKSNNKDGIQDDPAHEEYRTARNAYTQAVKREKKRLWEEWLETMDGEEVWKAGKLVGKDTPDGGRTRIPVLKVDGTKKADSNETKDQLFFDTFFPKRTADEIEPLDEYPNPKWRYKPTSNEQIDRVIKSLSPYKVSRSDSAPNSVFTHNRELLVPYLGPIYRSLDTFRFYPEEWKITQTPVLRKPGKSDYSAANAYRPITLADGFARIINMCKTEDLAKMAEIHDILPPNHIGGRTGRATTDSVHLMIKEIKDAWRRGEVTSTLFLDVKGAFPSVAMDVLLHEMRLMGIPMEHVEWVRRRNQGRRTKIIYDDHTSEEFEVFDGLDQGDAQSLILYLIYNSKILSIPNKHNRENALAFVDDVALMASAKTFEECHEKLQVMMEMENGVLEWARTHNCTFGIDKFQLVDSSRKTMKNPLARGKKKIPLTGPALKIAGHTIKPAPSAKFLGVHIDQGLRWKAHGAAAIAKGTAWLSQFQRLVKPSGGVAHRHMRRLYISIAIPRILYAADIFLSPATRTRKKITGGWIRNKLAAIHGKAANMIIGGMRSSPHDASIAHANLLPFHLLVDRIRHNAALRLGSLPESHPLAKHVSRAARFQIQTHRTPLHELMNTYAINPEKMEKIEAVRRGPRWLSRLSAKIAGNREAAKEEEEKRWKDNKWRIYTDGSGIEGNIGAAAVLYRGEEVIATLRHKLGSEEHHTVYEGEGVGIMLGIHLVDKIKDWRDSPIVIGVDNQAAITASISNKSTPSHYIWDIIHDMMDALHKKRPMIKLQLRWTPGHEGLIGNEKADEEAKKASSGSESNRIRKPADLPRELPYSRSALKRAYQTKLVKESKAEWAKSRRYGRIERFGESLPSKRYLDGTLRLTRKQSSLLYQLRTGHVPLAKHLARINKADSPSCPGCGHTQETVQHYLLQCPNYRQARQRMIRDGGIDATSLTSLLSDPSLYKHLFRFITSSGRLANVFGTVS